MNYGKTLIDIRLKDEDVVKQFAALHPDFAKFIEDREDGLPFESVQIIKYIVSCYDKESPTVNAYKKRWSVKKKESAQMAGLPFDSTGRFDEEVDNLLFCQNDVVNKIILRYVYLIHDRDWQKYVIYSEMYIHQSAELIKYNFGKPSDAKVAKENLENVDNDIEALEYRIFSGEETKKLKDLLYEEASNMLNELRPEKYVANLEIGLPPVDTKPYGDYQKEEMRFLGDE